jgi:hypothetical protein
MQTIARGRHVVRPAIFRILPPLSSCEGGRDGDVLPATALSVGVGDRLIGGVHFARNGADNAGVYTALRASGTVGIQTTNLPQGQAASNMLTFVDLVDNRTMSADQASAPARSEAVAAQGISRFSEAPQDRWTDRHGNR